MALSTLLMLSAAGAGVYSAAVAPRAVLAPAATTTQTASSANVTALSVYHNSTDINSYDGNSTDYYLGYRAADFAQPFAKYWNPIVAPLSDEVVNGLTASPWASALAYSAAEAPNYFVQPGYDNIENGWSFDSEGTLYIAVRSEAPEVTGDMYDWWFGWHQVQTARYKLWNPVAHQYAWRVPATKNFTGETYRETWIDTTSYIDEFVGESSEKLSIGFVDPESLGFNTTAWPELGIETIVTGQLVIGNHSTTEWDGKSYLMHQIRRMPNGYRELRSRFWVASTNGGTSQVGHDLAVHCNIEMTHLASFLPAIFGEFKDTV